MILTDALTFPLVIIGLVILLSIAGLAIWAHWPKQQNRREDLQ